MLYARNSILGSIFWRQLPLSRVTWTFVSFFCPDQNFHSFKAIDLFCLICGLSCVRLAGMLSIIIAGLLKCTWKASVLGFWRLFCGFKQQKCILSTFWEPEVKNQLYWADVIKVLAELCPAEGSREKSITLFSLWRLQMFLACGPITPAFACVATLPLFLQCLLPIPSLTRICVAGFSAQ